MGNKLSPPSVLRIHLSVHFKYLCVLSSAAGGGEPGPGQSAVGGTPQSSAGAGVGAG